MGMLHGAPDPLGPLPRPPLHERVADRVLSHVVQQDLEEGDRIPSERELARRLAVSRSSVRRAIASLVTAGVLESRHGGGTFVARPAGAMSLSVERDERRHEGGLLSVGDSGPILATGPPRVDDPLGFPGYRTKLDAVREKHGDPDLDVELRRLGSAEAVVVHSRFEYLAGTMGQAHGDRLIAAMASARRADLPFVAFVASGGARLQEGMLALLQLARAAEGMRALREAGVPTLIYLGHPSTGGVLASYGSLGDVVIADPGATIGFAGPRVVEAATGEGPTTASHHGRAAFHNGLVDGLALPHEALSRLSSWSDLLHPAVRGGELPAPRPADLETRDLSPAEVVRRARATDRPSVRMLVREIFDASLELSGDRSGGLDPVAVASVARLGHRSLVCVGFDRRATSENGQTGMPSPAGFRTIQRALRLADQQRLPVVALIDTRGADPSPRSEAAGIAGAIAETFALMLSIRTPTVAVVTGEGGSGGALALGAADVLLIQDDAYFSVISPEGAAAILLRDPARAADIVDSLKLRAQDLLDLGIVDGILPGPSTAGPARASAILRDRLSLALKDLTDDPRRLTRRRQRYGS